MKIPYTASLIDIDKLLNKHRKFILTQYQQLHRKKSLETDDTILFLGKPIPLEITINKAAPESFILQKGRVIVSLQRELSTQKKELLRAALYKKYAKEYLSPEFKELEQKMQLFATKLSFRKTKAQWGSCSIKNAISLNSYLLLLPKELREYVMVHELAHIVHKNHSKNFWSLVQKHYPKVKEARKALKEYAYFLRA